jgi:putative MATE family efflux protein
MILGLLSILLFNVVDALFVAQLGTHELAAISFTFPITYVVLSILLGLNVGTSSVVSYALGEGDSQQARYIATSSLILTSLIAFSVSQVGLRHSGPIFRLMHADEFLIPLIQEYIHIWFYGAVFLALPLTCNSILRASGNTRVPGLLMTLSAVINCILDPILIFGLFGAPRMELAGAALATVIAWGVSLIGAVYYVLLKKRLIKLSLPPLAQLLRSWREIARVAVPAATTHLLVPLSFALVTGLVATHGPAAVAGFGVGSRIEPLAMVVVMALSSVLIPFVGQNWGAGRLDRVHLAVKTGQLFALLWGLISFLVLAVGADWIALLFSRDPTVIRVVRAYLWTVPVSYGALGMAYIACASLNAIRFAAYATVIQLTRLFVLFVPLSYLGSMAWGLEGIFVGSAVANLLIGVVAYAVRHRFFPKP